MKFGKSRIFLFFCLSFILGVFLGRYLMLISEHGPVMAIVAMIFIIGITVFWKNRRVMLVGFLGLVLLVGAFRYQTSFPNQSPNFIGKFTGQTLTLEGIIVREPDIRSDKANLTLNPQGYEGKVLLNVRRYPEYQYGDYLKVTGKLEEPFVSEEFSYKDYLSRYDTYAVIRYPEIEKLAEGEGNKIVTALLAVKHKFQEVLSKILPEPHNALALGLILGLKRSLPEDLKQALIVAGVSHIVVISGYNISIITRNLLKVRSWWGRRAAFWLSLLTVIAFVILTGAEASVIRAAVMGMMVVLALNLGRLYNPVNALVFVGTIMVAQNPKILNFDVGFQLSFLATLGLAYLAPMFEKWLARLPDFLGFRTNLASTLSAQLFTLPLLIFHFDRISIVAPLVNVLILWVIPYAMFFAFFVGLAAIVFFPLGQIFAGLPWVFLEYQIRLVEFFAKVPWASVNSKINVLIVVIYYLLLVFGIWGYRHKKKFYYYLEYAKI